MRNVVQLCLAANNILLMRKWNHASQSFPKQKYRDLSVSRRSNDLLATDKSRLAWVSGLPSFSFSPETPDT